MFPWSLWCEFLRTSYVLCRCKRKFVLGFLWPPFPRNIQVGLQGCWTSSNGPHFARWHSQFCGGFGHKLLRRCIGGWGSSKKVELGGKFGFDVYLWVIWFIIKEYQRLLSIYPWQLLYYTPISYILHSHSCFGTPTETRFPPLVSLLKGMSDRQVRAAGRCSIVWCLFIGLSGSSCGKGICDDCNGVCVCGFQLLKYFHLLRYQPCPCTGLQIEIETGIFHEDVYYVHKVHEGYLWVGQTNTWNSCH